MIEKEIRVPSMRKERLTERSIIALRNLTLEVRRLRKIMEGFTAAYTDSVVIHPSEPSHPPTGEPRTLPDKPDEKPS